MKTRVVALFFSFLGAYFVGFYFGGESQSREYQKNLKEKDLKYDSLLKTKNVTIYTDSVHFSF